MTNSVKEKENKVEDVNSAARVEDASSGEEKSPSEIHNPLFGTDFEKKLLRKIDLRLVPIMILCYGTSLMDRGNLPNARIAGMGEDLGFDIGQRYSIVSLVFFPAYIITELPANLLIKRLPPSIFLGTVTLIFGIIMVCFGFINDWKVMVATRFLLGFFEGCLLPGIVYLMSSWYLRNEVGLRISTMYLCGVICSAVSNPLAYAFSLADGAGGLEGWRYIFILFGLITCVVGFAALFVIPAFPQNTTFLNPEEKQLALDRLNRDRGDIQVEPTTFKGVLKCCSDWKVWMLGVMFSFATVSSYAHSYFLAIILRDELGFSIRDAQVLTMCPYFPAVIFGVGCSYWADRIQLRGPFIASGYVLTIVGLSLLAFAPVNGVRYFGSFLSLPGTQTTVSMCLVWKANNVVGSLKRACSSAIVVIFGGVGGIVASVAYNQNDAPQYVPGIATTIAAQGVGCIMTLLLMTYFNHKNKQMKSGKITEPLEGQKGFYYIL